MYKQTDREKVHAHFCTSAGLSGRPPLGFRDSNNNNNNNNNSNKFVKTSTIVTIEVTMLNTDRGLDCLI